MLKGLLACCLRGSTNKEQNQNRKPEGTLLAFMKKKDHLTEVCLKFSVCFSTIATEKIQKEPAGDTEGNKTKNIQLEERTAEKVCSEK